jgi:hypothetical protein
MTFEGYAWEKVATAGLRKVAPAPYTIGYVHGQFLPGLTNLRIGAGAAGVPSPDRVVAAGEATTQALVGTAGYDPGRVRTGCSLRWRPSEEGGVPGGHSGVLVVLGEFDRARRLVRFIGEVFTRDQPAVCLRHHPATDVDEFEQAVRDEIGCVPGTRSARDDLRDDLAASDVVVYDASSVCLDALSLGKPVVHVDLGEGGAFDPLWDYDGPAKAEAKTPEELASAVEAFMGMSPEEREAVAAEAREVVKRYITPPSAACVKAFLPDEETSDR